MESMRLTNPSILFNFFDFGKRDVRHAYPLVILVMRFTSTTG
jgi:hypothetical protein